MPPNLTISKSDTTKTYESYEVPSTTFTGRLWSSGVEQQDLSTTLSFYSDGEFDIVLNATVSTVIFHPGGVASANMNITNGQNADIGKQLAGNNYPGKLYARGYVYFASLPNNIITTMPNNNSDVSIMVIDNGTDTMVELCIDGSGVLRAYQDGTVRSVFATTSAISTNTWYCVEIAVSSSYNYAEFRLNGISQGSTYSAYGMNPSNRVDFGLALESEESVIGNLYWDDMAVNCDAGSYQNSWPGLGQIVNLVPGGPGDNNAFTINVGGTLGQINNYTRVNSFGPINDSQYNGDTFSGDIDDFTVTPTPSTISSGDTINVVHVGIRHRLNPLEYTSTLSARIKKTSMGTIASYAFTSLGNTFYNFAIDPRIGFPFAYPLTLYTDPDGNPWHKSTLDSTQIGYEILNVPLGSEYDISDVWLVVDSTPGDASLLINTSDTTITSESITFDYELYFGVSDTTTTSESVNATQILEISVVSDVTATGEMAVVAPPYVVILDDPSDTTLVNEDITVLIPLAGHLYINTLDSVSTAESVSSVQESHTYIGVYGPLIFNIETQPYTWQIVRKNPNDP